MTAGVEPSSRAGVFRRMRTSRVAQATLQSLDELLHSSCRCHDAFACRSHGLRRSTDERRAQARRIAGVHTLEGWAQEPPGRPASQHPRAPFFDGLERPRAPRAPRGRRREPRGQREPLSGVQWPAPGSLAVDVPVAAGRPGGAQHRKPQIAAQLVDTGRFPQPDCRRFNGPVRRLERRDETAEPIGLLDDLDGDSRARQIVRGRKPGETSPDHRDGLHRSERWCRIRPRPSRRP